MSTHEQDDNAQEHDHGETDELLKAQEHKGYGEDEGERDEALEEAADE